ncbi:MAG: hypothetical protein IT318_23680 [Anaerolineales bacterium]|nr:hypothetical protein [Anaerolineales bacterium]
MQIDWAKLGEILPAAVLAIIFAIFAIILLLLMAHYLKQLQDAQTSREAAREIARQADLDRHARQDREREELLLQVLDERDKRSVTAFADLAATWQKGVVDDHARLVEVGSLHTRELERLSALVMMTNTILKEHDVWERAWFEAL